MISQVEDMGSDQSAGGKTCSDSKPQSSHSPHKVKPAPIQSKEGPKQPFTKHTSKHNSNMQPQNGYQMDYTQRSGKDSGKPPRDGERNSRDKDGIVSALMKKAVPLWSYLLSESPSGAFLWLKRRMSSLFVFVIFVSVFPLMGALVLSLVAAILAHSVPLAWNIILSRTICQVKFADVLIPTGSQASTGYPASSFSMPSYYPAPSVSTADHVTSSAAWYCGIPLVSHMSACQTLLVEKSHTDRLDTEALMSSQNQIRSLRDQSKHGDSLSTSLMGTVDGVEHIRTVLGSIGLPESDTILAELDILESDGYELSDDLKCFFVEIRDVILRVDGENRFALRRAQQLEDSVKSPYSGLRWLPESWVSLQIYKTIAEEYLILLQSNEDKVIELRQLADQMKSNLAHLKADARRLRDHISKNLKPLKEEHAAAKDITFWAWGRKDADAIQKKLDILDNLDKQLLDVLGVVNSLREALGVTQANLGALLKKTQNPQFDWSPKTVEEAMDYLRTFIQRVQVSVKGISQHAGRIGAPVMTANMIEVNTRPAVEAPRSA